MTDINNEFAIKLAILQNVLINKLKCQQTEELADVLLKARELQIISENEFQNLMPMIKADFVPNAQSLKIVDNILSQFEVSNAPLSLAAVFEKLSIKSKESLVNGNAALDDFHNYLHVSRPIEADFEATLKTCIPNNTRTLTLLVGNVGDGKSHLIAYEQNKYQQLFNDYQIKIHNDATESLRADETAVDTLMEHILIDFDDNHDQVSNVHLIVAINMGILTNFVAAAKKAGRYQRLCEFIEKTNILTDIATTTFAAPGSEFQLLTFNSDNKLVLNDAGEATSQFITGILAKVTQKNANNPFFNAYLHDHDEQNMILKKNYELLMNQGVQATLVNLLVRVQIQFQQLLSVRQIMNFIHDLVIPPKDVTGYQALLPALLFSGQMRSSLLDKAALLDPTLIQNSQIDEINSRLFNTTHFTDEVQQICSQLKLSYADIAAIIDYLDHQLTNAQTDDARYEEIKFVLRLLYLLKHDYDFFEDQDYLDFLAALTAAQSYELTKRLKRILQQGIQNWNGHSPINRTVFTDPIAQNVAIKLSLQFDHRRPVMRDGVNLRIAAVKPEIAIGINFQTFQLLRKVCDGYVLRNIDLQEAVDFNQFVQKTISYNNVDDVYIRLPQRNKFVQISDTGIDMEVSVTNE